MPRTRPSLLLVPLCVLAACTQAPPPAPPPEVAPGTAAPAPSSAVASPDLPPSPSPLPARALVGEVLGLDGAPLSGVQVEARSLDEATPFTATARTDAAGRWQLVAAPPPGTTVAVEASGEGLTTRRQVVTTGLTQTAVSFGGTGAGAAFFLSDRPEVTRTEPVPDGALAAAGGLRYRLTLSRRLAPESQERLLSALRLAPANEPAAGGAGVTDLTRRPRRHPDARVAAGLGPYALRVGDRLTRRSSLRVRGVWEADGRTLTLSFDGALLSGKERARYQVLLVADGRALLDEAGHALGTGPTGELDSVPAAGEVLLGAFAAPDPELGAVTGLPPGSAAARWAGTHDAAIGFFVPADERPPQLTGLEVEREGGDTRLRLGFDEPLLACDGSDEGRRGSGTGLEAADLSGLTFLLGDRKDLPTRLLRDGREDEAVVVDPRTQATHGAAGQRGVAFRFAAGAFVAEGASAPTGSVRLAIDRDDPSVLLLTIVGRSAFFDPAAEALAVRCEGLGDVAGNRRKAALADDNLLTTPL